MGKKGKKNGKGSDFHEKPAHGHESSVSEISGQMRNRKQGKQGKQSGQTPIIDEEKEMKSQKHEKKRVRKGGVKMQKVENSETPEKSGKSEESEESSSQDKDVGKLKRKLYQSRRVTFILGAVLGLIATAVLMTMSSDNIKSELDKLMMYDSFNNFVEDWRYSMPSGLQSMIDMYDAANKNELRSAESFSVGLRMKDELNLTPKYNVVMVPGVISTGLESWGVSNGGDCPSLPHFRKRLWGSFYMLRTMFLDKACWLKHIKLDPETGLDPPNIKVRASAGFDGADFFVPGYWIWNKILQNLAVIGYGPENMISATYDWRLAYADLERRDGYFTKLMLQVETTRKLKGQKSFLVGHSMGSQVIMYFMKWVEAKGPGFGNRGDNWCNENLAGIIDISGSLLGTPKTISALISGEMKDTVQLNYLAVYGLEKFFSKKERVEMIRTFGGIPAMIPKGGEDVWGNLTHAPDDPGNELLTDVDVNIEGPKNHTLGKFIRYRACENSNGGIKDYTLDQSIEKLLEISPNWLTNRIRENYSFGVAKTTQELEANNKDPSKWSNPLEVALPNAPDMKIYCLYGVGNPTERAYTYKKADKESGLPFVIDTQSEHPVYFGDGDGTVSLMTHYICHEWQKPNSRFNPAGIEVKVVEMKHDPASFDIRGGAKTAEHVDILGSAELNELILKVVTGHGSTIENNYVSELRNISMKMDV